MKRKRLDGKTPLGGDYSVIIYFDDDMREVEEEVATNAVIFEYNKDDSLVGRTTYMIKR